jgi:hypothetical protein
MARIRNNSDNYCNKNNNIFINNTYILYKRIFCIYNTNFKNLVIILKFQRLSYVHKDKGIIYITKI